MHKNFETTAGDDAV